MMPTEPHPGKHARKPPEVRIAEILWASTAVFAERGYRLTDVQMVADRAGVGKGTVYRFFPTKENLFLATVADALDRLRQQVNEATEAVDDPIGKLRAAVRCYLRFFDRSPETVELFIQERAEFREEAKPLYFVYEEHDREDWLPIFEQLQGEGRLQGVSIEVAFQVLGDLVYGTVVSNQLSARRQPLEGQADLLLDIFLHGLLDNDEPPGQRSRRSS